jgi:hypothetical protein
MLSEAARVPLAVGVKVTLIVHLLLAANALPQVLVWAKSPALVPVIARLVMLKAAVPVLLRVMACAVLLVPTDWLPNVRVVAERLTLGVVPVPDRLSV